MESITDIVLYTAHNVYNNTRCTDNEMTRRRCVRGRSLRRRFCAVQGEGGIGVTIIFIRLTDGRKRFYLRLFIYFLFYAKRRGGGTARGHGAECADVGSKAVSLRRNVGATVSYNPSVNDPKEIQS